MARTLPRGRTPTAGDAPARGKMANLCRVLARLSRPAFPHPSVLSDGGGLVGRSTINYSIGMTAHHRPMRQPAVRAPSLHTSVSLPSLPSSVLRVSPISHTISALAVPR